MEGTESACLIGPWDTVLDGPREASVLRSRNRLSASEAGLVWGLGYCIVEEVVYGFYSFSYYDCHLDVWH